MRSIRQTESDYAGTGGTVIWNVTN